LFSTNLSIYGFLCLGLLSLKLLSLVFTYLERPLSIAPRAIGILGDIDGG